MALEKEGGGGDNLDVGWTGPVIGTTITSIAGKYCTAVIRNPEPLFKAQNPTPANGATEVTNPLFTWVQGATAVLNEVYCRHGPRTTSRIWAPGRAPCTSTWPV